MDLDVVPPLEAEVCAVNTRQQAQLAARGWQVLGGFFERVEIAEAPTPSPIRKVQQTFWLVSGPEPPSAVLDRPEMPVFWRAVQLISASGTVVDNADRWCGVDQHLRDWRFRRPHGERPVVARGVVACGRRVEDESNPVT